jgi:hypothetical protein
MGSIIADANHRSGPRRDRNREREQGAKALSTLRGHTAERLTIIVSGLGTSGLLFSGFLYVYLDPSRRPLSPDPGQGHTSFIHAKHGDVYGPHFEQLASTYGSLLMLAVLLAGAAFSFRFFYVEKRPRNLPLAFIAAALSMAVYLTLWMSMP